MQLILVVKAIIFVDAKGGVGVCGPLDVLKRVFLMEICLHEWIVILFLFPHNQKFLSCFVFCLFKLEIHFDKW